MGAFGELLIKTMGGDLDKYLGNYYQSNSNTKIVKTIDKTIDKNIGYDDKLYCARKRLDMLKNTLMYRPQDVKYYTENSIKGGFKQLGYDDNIQNIMWSEYSEFILRCVLK